MHYLTKSVYCSVSAMGLLAACGAHAQSSSPSTDTPTTNAAADGSESTVGDIIVTANKREENINKVGLSITALSGEALAERKITSLQDIASAVPGLSYAASTANTPVFTLRGIGFNESSLGVYPAVSVYVDQAPLPFPVLASHSAYDLERIEVLKGPQGTLFGQNSTGGAINYIAAKPTDTFTAGGDVSYGRFNTIEGNAHISGPITDTLGFRVAVTGLNSDDWQKSYTRDDTNGHQSYMAGRLLLEWKPTDATKLSLSLNGWIDKSQPQAQQLVAVAVVNPPFSNPAYLSYPFPPRNARAADWTDTFLDNKTGVIDPATGATVPGTAQLTSIDPKSNRKFYQPALRADTELSDDITLTSLTSYAHFTQHQRTDGDGVALAGFDLERGDGYIHSLNQELRLANDPKNRFRWVVGGNYERSRTFENQIVNFSQSSGHNPMLFNFNGAGVTNKQRIENYAIFGNIDFSISKNLTAKGGIRYTDSKNVADICSYAPLNTNIDKLFNLLGTLYGTVPFAPIHEGDCYALNQNLVPGQPFKSTLHQDNVSWRVELDYQANSSTLMYANISRGYKAGSFPTLAASAYRSLRPVTQESVTAYEAGIKTSLWDRRVRLNAATFYYDYRDKQIRGKIIDSPNVVGIIDALVNIPKSRVMGAEADVSVRLIDGLRLSGNVTYLDTKIQRFEGYSFTGQLMNFAGSPLPLTSKWSGVVNVDYRHPLLSGGTPFFGVTVNARSSSDASPGGRTTTYAPGTSVRLAPGVTYPYTIRGYATVDARLGYEAEGGAWRVMLWGKNILNKYYWTSVNQAYDSSSRMAGMPATYGITFGFGFR
ncbi:TonB-dependent receptor [Sphingobium sp. BS19]|uniref:TonB-dependent receptor n=1 Tax=Sphingobium sp. BS19 TaxID=3018973 RepID=UPI0022EEB4BC|nr:TonB-dependent receptor [Sphingobium sp. BS19]GLJ00358.1 TonB-dependent receptor [Sphingobium sp. BS19]